MVDHNIEKIADATDKVLVLHNGQVVDYGDTKSVFTNKSLLNEHFVRVPQVTDAALSLGNLPGEVPITLEAAKTAFAGLKK